jgi:hypothetical protein
MITDPLVYKIFKKWFVKEREYIKHFDLEKLAEYVSKHDSIDGLTEHEIWELQREYIIFASLMQFLAYMRSIDTPKEHEILLPLLMLDFLGSPNIVMFDDVTPNVHLNCWPIDHKKHAHIFIKHAQFYEPICKVSSGKTFVPLDELNEIVLFMEANCVAEPDSVIPKDAVKQVLNLSFKIIGYTLSNGCFLGLPQPIPMHPGVQCTHRVPSKNAAVSRYNDMGWPLQEIPSHDIDLQIFGGIQLDRKFVDNFNRFSDTVTSCARQIIDDPEFEFLRHSDNFFQKDVKMHILGLLLNSKTNEGKHMTAHDRLRVADALLSRDIAFLLRGTRKFIGDGNVKIMSQDEATQFIGN